MKWKKCLWNPSLKEKGIPKFPVENWETLPVCMATLLLEFHKWMLKWLSYLFFLTLLFFVILTLLFFCAATLNSFAKYSGLVTKILIDIVFHPTCLRSSVHEVPTNWKQKYLSFLYSFRYWLRHQIINVPNKGVNKGSKWPNSSGCLFFSSNSILRDISGVI